MIDLSTFADRYAVRDDGSGSLEIAGARGTVYAYSSRALAVFAEGDVAVRQLATLGLTVLQRGDTEAVFAFDPRKLDEVASVIQAKRKA